MQELKELIDDFCDYIDMFSKVELTPCTPMHTFQQSMIANVKRWREAQRLYEIDREKETEKAKEQHDSNIPVLQHVERKTS